MSGGPKKLVLTVIDAMKPAMLERAVQTGRAPALKLLMERGSYVDDCVAAFPSVTPVCAASIATGRRARRARDPVDELVPPRRGALRRVRHELQGLADVRLQALAHRHDLQHEPRAPLRRSCETVFETLDDADVRTAGTTYLIYRGRHRHEVTSETALTRLASTVFRHAVYGPREFFYADIFASRKTGCRAQLGLPGQRDQHAGLRRRRAGRERPVRLPAALAARQRHPLAPQRAVRAGVLDRGRRQADRAPDARRRAARTSSSRTTR